MIDAVKHFVRVNWRPWTTINYFSRSNFSFVLRLYFVSFVFSSLANRQIDRETDFALHSLSWRRTL